MIDTSSNVVAVDIQGQAKQDLTRLLYDEFRSKFPLYANLSFANYQTLALKTAKNGGDRQQQVVNYINSLIVKLVSDPEFYNKVFQNFSQSATEKHINMMVDSEQSAYASYYEAAIAKINRDLNEFRDSYYRSIYGADNELYLQWKYSSSNLRDGVKTRLPENFSDSRYFSYVAALEQKKSEFTQAYKRRSNIVVDRVRATTIDGKEINSALVFPGPIVTKRIAPNKVYEVKYRDRLPSFNSKNATTVSSGRMIVSYFDQNIYQAAGTTNSYYVISNLPSQAIYREYTSARYGNEAFQQPANTLGVIASAEDLIDFSEDVTQLSNSELLDYFLTTGSSNAEAEALLEDLDSARYLDTLTTDQFLGYITDLSSELDALGVDFEDVVDDLEQTIRKLANSNRNELTATFITTRKVRYRGKTFDLTTFPYDQRGNLLADAYYDGFTNQYIGTNAFVPEYGNVTTFTFDINKASQLTRFANRLKETQYKLLLQVNTAKRIFEGGGLYKYYGPLVGYSQPIITFNL